MQGTTQSIGISSTPSGATVKVNNVDKGQTPTIVDLKRKDQHFVKIELPGYYKNIENKRYKKGILMLELEK